MSQKPVGFCPQAFLVRKRLFACMEAGVWGLFSTQFLNQNMKCADCAQTFGSSYELVARHPVRRKNRFVFTRMELACNVPFDLGSLLNFTNFRILVFDFGEIIYPRLFVASLFCPCPWWFSEPKVSHLKSPRSIRRADINMGNLQLKVVRKNNSEFLRLWNFCI